MARHEHKGTTYDFRFWPFGLSTPARFDNSSGVVDRVWRAMRTVGLIQCRKAKP